MAIKKSLLLLLEGGRLDDELNYLNRIRNEHQHHLMRNKRSSPNDSSVPIMPINAEIVKRPIVAPEIPVDASLSGGFQVIIQTPDLNNRNILTKEGLLLHVDLLEEISQYTVEMFGEWVFKNIKIIFNKNLNTNYTRT